MRAPANSERLPVTGHVTWYACQAAAYPWHTPDSINLGFHQATSPRLALRWIRDRAGHVVDQLDTAYAHPGRYWLTDEAEHESALAYLTSGSAYQLTLYDESVRYVLTASPTGATGVPS
ncbi:hypothetical protein AB0O67_01925 [Streptomyces sp. NPDC086077]|uniref:hypothetical protein n=1 Tax=Streptomyces sp. NPDC086077 TaxID=3154862 RepID=UPI003443B766